MRLAHRGAALLFASAALVGATVAGAQPAVHDTAAAEAAFAEARALIRQGEYAAACPKLEASYRLDPALGTLLNLSDCFERTGRNASAWVRYREAAAMAVQQGQREREAIARARVAALEPLLCRLVMRTSQRPTLEVARDGVVVDHAVIDLPVPVDPGPHVVTADARGATTFTAHVEVRAPQKEGPCALTVVEIPAHLEGEDTAPAAPPFGPPRAEESSSWGTPHTLAVVASSAGVVACGVGAFFALKASGTKSDADALCPSGGCTPEGKSLMADAGASADVATVTVVLGAVLLATGAVVWLASPSLRRVPRTALVRF
jgi:hypothetical protein